MKKLILSIGIGTAAVGVMLLPLVLLLNSCRTEITDISTEPGFEDLVGVCLELRTDLFAQKMNSGRFSFWNTSEGPGKTNMRDGDWIVPAGSRIILKKVEYVETWDMSYAVYIGQLESDDHPGDEFTLSSIIDSDWKTETKFRLTDGESVEVDVENLPFRWHLVELCTVTDRSQPIQQQTQDTKPNRSVLLR